jgi:hypothetical protein
MFYSEELALAVIAKNPDLVTEAEILNAAFPLMVADLGSKRRANNTLNYNEDFAPDLITAYRHYQRKARAC